MKWNLFLTAFLIATLTFSIFPAIPTVYAQEEYEYYWGRGLMNEGNSTFFNSTDTANKFSKEIIRPVDGGYDWNHSTTGDYYEQEFYIENTLDETNWMKAEFQTPDSIYRANLYSWDGSAYQLTGISEGGIDAYLVNGTLLSHTASNQTGGFFIEGDSGTTQNQRSALHFDGTNDVVTVTDDATINFSATDSFSIEYWVKTSTSYTTGAPGYVLDKRDAGSNLGYRSAIGEVTNQKASFIIADVANAPQIGGATTITDGEWHHIVCVRDVATDKLYLYVDGLSDATAVTDTTVGSLGNGNSLKIMAHRNLGTYTVGCNDEFRIYNRTLTPTEVSEHYQGIFTDESDLVLYLDMDEGTGATAFDSSGEANNGAITSATWINPVDTMTYSGRYGCTGRSGFAIQMPASSTTQLLLRVYYQATTTTITQGTEYGFEAVIAPTDPTNVTVILDCSNLIDNGYMDDAFSDLYFFNSALQRQVYNISQTLYVQNPNGTFAFQFGNTNETNTPPISGLMSLQAQRSAGYVIGIEFSKSNPYTLHIGCDAGDRGIGYAFTSFDREWLHGKTLSINWSGLSSGGAAHRADVLIYDGEYYRNSTDFPDSAPISTKGAGLLQTVFAEAGTFALNINTTTVNVSTGTEERVTVFIRFEDTDPAQLYDIYIDFLNVTVAGETYFSNDMVNDVNMQLEGTNWDFGYLLNDPDEPTESVTLTLDSTYFRLHPTYVVLLRDTSNNPWTNFTQNIELDTQYIDNPLDLGQATNCYGIYFQPDNMTATHSDGVDTYDYLELVSLALETIIFYLGDPGDMLRYDIWLNDYSGFYEDGRLDTFLRLNDGSVDTTYFNGTFARVWLEPDTVYYFQVVASGITFRSEAWQPSATDLSHIITIIQIPLSPITEWDHVVWTAGRSGNNTVVVAQFRETSDATIRIYNSTNDLMNTTSYDDVTGFTFNYNETVGNQTYWALLNVTSASLTEEYTEVRAVYRVAMPGETMLIPLPFFDTGMISPGIFSLFLLFGVAMIFSAYNRVIGLVISTSFLVMFNYFGWLDINMNLIAIIVVATILYAFKYKGGERET